MRTLRSTLAVILLGGLVLQPALADPGRLGGALANEHQELEHGHREPGRMSPSEAARLAQERNGGGRVLSVDSEGNGYRVKLLQRGDVHIVFIPSE
ncbi:MAG: hypothetical protein E6R07_09020 [Nevskiaceae bacterium]|nr:MAG: hypothetical protein E6R07_09020 [Nevskiaceae bacterium]